MVFDVGLAIGGLVVLILAADRLVVAATRLSKALGISAILIGAVVVGFGTSVPEFVVSGIAAARGELEVAMGNVAASNTANVTLVLGAAAVVVVLASRAAVVRREGYLMIAAVFALSVMLVGGTVNRWEGAVLLVLLVVALLLMIRWARTPGSAVVAPATEENTGAPPVWREIVLAIIALAAVVIAAQLMLEGLISIGDRLGWDAVFLGLITGVGTSLPELAAAIAAARKRESDLILGNVLGSNIFNSLGVAGLAAVIGPGVVVGFGPLLVVMVAACLVAGSFALTGQRLVRWEGLALLAAFGTYAVLSF